MSKRRRKFPKIDLERLFDEQKGICACGCGERLTKDEGYDLDHIIPLGMGGKDDMQNAQYLRRPCHSVKTFTKIDGDISRMAKARRIMGQGALLKPKTTKGRRLQSRGFDKRFKKKLDGSVERR